MHVSWSSWGSSAGPDEGVYTGSVSISASGVGFASASVTADNRAPDSPYYVYVSRCLSPSGYTCATGSTVTVNIHRNAQGSFVGSLIDTPTIVGIFPNPNTPYTLCVNQTPCPRSSGTNYPSSTISQFSAVTRAPVTRHSTHVKVTILDVAGQSATVDLPLS